LISYKQTADGNQGSPCERSFMCAFIIISLSAFFVSGLTLYSGFGLGTLMMPVFAVFFPVPIAVAATAVVHGANNIFKIILVGRHADASLVLRFGVPALAAAFLGACMLEYVSRLDPIATYSLGFRVAEVTPIKLTMGILILSFSLFELLPVLRTIAIDKKYLFVGGLLSGFFGGLSGHQGALRSAFLAKMAVSTETFVGTSAAIGFLVDMTRIAVYAALFLGAGKAFFLDSSQLPLVATAILAAFAGVIAGKRYLRTVTMKTIQAVTGVLLMVIALSLGTGIL
jgi:uncharacterized protein